MEPNKTIPIVTTPEEFEKLITDGFIGIANVRLDNKIVNLMLTRNSANRKPKNESVMAYVSTFTKYGYESIALMSVASDGTLLDGQHRLLALQAIYKNGVNLDAWNYVNFGVPKERMADIDNGVARSYRDTLQLMGVVTSCNYASAVRFYASLISPINRVKFSAAELAELWEKDFKQVLEIGTFSHIAGTGLTAQYNYKPVSWVIAGFRLCQKKFGTEQMQEVYKQFYAGTDLQSPMVYFRNFIVTHKGECKLSRRSGLAQKYLGILFGAVQKAIKEEVCNSYIRPAKLGIEINGIEF